MKEGRTRKDAKGEGRRYRKQWREGNRRLGRKNRSKEEDISREEYTDKQKN